jgi:hypothetical protein
MMLNRKQFKQHWDAINPKLACDGGPLWVMENYADNRPSRWFVQIPRPREDWTDDKKNQYWSWCHRHCAGQILCYSYGDDREWWGFTHQADIVLWLLRWS